MVNQERLWNHLMEVAKIGQQEAGGVTRVSFSEQEREVKDLVAGYMKEAGLHVYEDAVGNLIGRKEGKNPQAPAILTGSHLDTVYNGGNFDGVLGVLGGVEALHTMNENGIETEHPIEVIGFTDEEGARFSFGMIGSRGIAGTLTAEELEQKDKQGISIAEAMRESGLDPLGISQAARAEGSVKAFVELHIEQGKILESQDQSVGVVTGIYSQLWDRFVLEGEAGHAGTTPMNLRNDPLVAASAIMLEIEEEARKTGSVATVGQLHVFPGGINIIPGRVEFTLDLRNLDEKVRDEIELRLINRSRQICEERGVVLHVENLQKNLGVPCASFIQEASKEACNKLGLEIYSLPSGAGHDAMKLIGLCPVGMIFVRSQNGLSHNPAEFSSPEDCRDGVNVLYHTVLQLARA